jgi:hypothetical protein
MARPRVFPVIAFATAALAVAQGAQFVDRTPANLASLLLLEAAAADFDGDGDLDLCGGATFFGAPTPVVLLRNDGSERFVDVGATLPALPSGWASQVLTPFDMDADGDVDLLLCTQSASRLWRNVGNLTFVDATANLPAGTAGYTDAAAADFDGDGDLDLVAISGVLAGNNSKLFVNQGSGTFVASPTFPTGNGFDVAVADFDQDGDPDLAIARGGLRLLRNDGSQGFTDVTTAWLPGLTITLAVALAFGDFLPGGAIDLAVAAGNAELVLHNSGSASPRTSTRTATSTSCSAGLARCASRSTTASATWPSRRRASRCRRCSRRCWSAATSTATATSICSWPTTAATRRSSSTATATCGRASRSPARRGTSRSRASRATRRCITRCVWGSASRS